jgi:hypothetical protein
MMTLEEGEFTSVTQQHAALNLAKRRISLFSPKPTLHNEDDSAEPPVLTLRGFLRVARVASFA